ncbi:3-ketoacyl-ACP reductase [Mesorhizobium sp. KR9-304]|uniref:3-ketoacyl-ACP reductase n=1 Tax=Mesorhizobium sp. KR9-304 TaxID=3156614 RepID=UPI0032B35BFC
MSDGRVALVTGGCSGIGLAAAYELARGGLAVGILDRTVPDREGLIEALKALGAPSAHVVSGDLALIESHDELLDAIEAALGPVDVLVNNAGVPAKVRGDLLEMKPDSFDQVLGINLRGTFFLTQTVGRRMAARPRVEGHARCIVVVSSVSAVMASPERGEYCLSKSALPMLVKLFALRLAGHGVGVFEIRPGIIRTPMTAGVVARYDPLIEGGLVPAGRWGEPEDIARAVRLLVQNDLSFATGSVVAADGGLSIARL